MDGLKARLSFDAVAYDYDDEYLTIDTDTHTININNVSRLFGVQYDGNSKLIKFKIRNKLSDIQKMQDSIVYINWIDSRGVKGQSIAINKTINNDTCEFAWKVPFDALKNSGVLHFAMSAVVTKNSSSVIDQRWSTKIASVITPDGIYIKSYTPSSEEEDRIAQIYNELSNMINKQNDNLQSQVNLLKEDLANYDDGKQEFIHKFIKDKFIYINSAESGTNINLTPIDSTTKLSYIIIDVRAGEKYELRVKGSGNARAYLFIDENNNAVLGSNGTNNGNDFYDKPITLTVPNNARKLVSQNYYQLDGCYLTKKTKTENRLEALEKEKLDVNSYKVAMPNWSGIFEWEDKTGYRMGNYVWDTKKFEEWYNLFHNVYTSVNNDDLLEEIDIGSEYNTAKNETTPDYISNISPHHGSTKMYHVKPFAEDGSNYSVKHRKIKLMIVSGIHGSEKKSLYDNYLLLNGLVSGVPYSRALTILRNFCDIYIVPLVNVYGIENNTRNNININLNRDFAVDDWVATADSGDVPNSQWETRVLSYQMDKIKPDVFIDHHTSSGDANTERGKFVQWVDSDIKSILSLIEENIMDITPYIRSKFPSKFENYNHVYGHTEDSITNIESRYGTCRKYAYQKCNSISIIYEVVMHLKWEKSGYIFGYDEESENNIVSMNYFGFINMIMKLVSKSAEYINENINYLYSN